MKYVRNDCDSPVNRCISPHTSQQCRYNSTIRCCNTIQQSQSQQQQQQRSLRCPPIRFVVNVWFLCVSVLSIRFRQQPHPVVVEVTTDRTSSIQQQLLPIIFVLPVAYSFSFQLQQQQMMSFPLQKSHRRRQRNFQPNDTDNFVNSKNQQRRYHTRQLQILFQSSVGVDASSSSNSNGSTSGSSSGMMTDGTANTMLPSAMEYNDNSRHQQQQQQALPVVVVETTEQSLLVDDGSRGSIVIKTAGSVDVFGIETLSNTTSTSAINTEVLRKNIFNALLLGLTFGYAAYTIFNIDHGMTRGWTQSEIAMRIPLDNWLNYESSLTDRPIATKTAINVIIYLLGDWLSQTAFSGKDILDFNAARTIRNGFIGLCFGPLVHEYYQFSDHILPVDGGMFVRLQKIMMDQTIYLSVKCSIYISAVGLLQGDDVHTVKQNVQTKLPGIVLTAWKFWPLVHLVTYGVIPARHRILWVNCVDLIWNAILATMSQKKDDSTASDSIDDVDDINGGDQNTNNILQLLPPPIVLEATISDVQTMNNSTITKTVVR